MGNPRISIVIIGKNEENNIKRCIESVEGSLKNKLVYEIIYIDSDSTDKTVDFAIKYNISVYKLSSTNKLTASKGRYIGAQLSKYEYILFLDGDMELLNDWTENAIRVISDREDVAGIIGIRNDRILSDNIILSSNINKYGTTEMKQAHHFGGAVLFKKNDLLRAGNYSPSLIANEEAELHSRFMKNNKKILEQPMEMINHYIEEEKYGNDFIRILFNKRNLGIGQGFMNSIYKHSTIYFIKRFKYFFISLFIDIISVLLLIYNLVVINVHIFVFILFMQCTNLLINVIFRKWHYYILDKISFLYLLIGMATYEKNPEINVEKIK